MYAKKNKRLRASESSCYALRPTREIINLLLPPSYTFNQKRKDHTVGTFASGISLVSYRIRILHFLKIGADLTSQYIPIDIKFSLLKSRDTVPLMRISSGLIDYHLYVDHWGAAIPSVTAEILNLQVFNVTAQHWSFWAFLLYR